MVEGPTRRLIGLIDLPEDRAFPDQGISPLQIHENDWTESFSTPPFQVAHKLAVR